ncbi:MAG: VacJ family lipoprotein [Gallionella sp.]|nr:VacJ family lipoprotein [Gallionella sp.]MDD4946632.1 VacJ family lipoprotein [Gallionella sp.]MDD5612909.1 VacJ family lipoprotein [Gallionella sp.]
MKLIRTFALLAAVSLTGCATGPARNPADPFEPMNRGIYKFNDTVDKVIAKPVAQGYKTVMPETGKTLVSNFFSNLNDVVVTANDLLQFKFKQGFSDAMRFLVNSSVGAGGLIDVASMRLEKHDEDFGQTLGYWGMENGPYLVLPLLGSSSFRDGIGLLGDGQVSVISRTRHVRSRNQLFLAKAINRRSQLLTQEQVMEGAMIDRYTFLRDAYLQYRINEVYDGNPPHDKLEDEELNFNYQPDAPAPTAPPTPTPGSKAPGAVGSPVSSTTADLATPLAIAPESLSDAAAQLVENTPPSVVKVWVARR